MGLGSPRNRHPLLPMPLPTLLLLLVLAGNGNAAAANEAAGSSPIKNVVVLALENRSFDHMLGWMRRLLGLPVDGLTGAECNPSNSSSSTTTTPVCVSADADLVVPDDPGHSFEDVLEQVFGFRPNSTTPDSISPPLPSMSGFVRSALSVNALLSGAVMRGFNPLLLPAFYALASDFAVFDHWFSSILGPTQPNRLFLYSTTSHGTVATSHGAKPPGKLGRDAGRSQSYEQHKLNPEAAGGGGAEGRRVKRRRRLERVERKRDLGRNQVGLN